MIAAYLIPPAMVDGKHLMLIQSETSVFKFLLHGVDGFRCNVDRLDHGFRLASLNIPAL